MLRKDPLGQPVEGLAIRCGGTIEHTRWRGGNKPCSNYVIVRMKALVNQDDLSRLLQSVGWSLALASTKSGSAVVDGELQVAGDAFFDPLCSDCTTKLLARLNS